MEEIDPDANDRLEKLRLKFSTFPNRGRPAREDVTQHATRMVIRTTALSNKQRIIVVREVAGKILLPLIAWFLCDILFHFIILH